MRHRLPILSLHTGHQSSSTGTQFLPILSTTEWLVQRFGRLEAHKQSSNEIMKIWGKAFCLHCWSGRLNGTAEDDSHQSDSWRLPILSASEASSFEIAGSLCACHHLHKVCRLAWDVIVCKGEHCQASTKASSRDQIQSTVCWFVACANDMFAVCHNGRWAGFKLFCRMDAQASQLLMLQ